MNHIYTTPGMFAPATIVESEPQRKETSQSIRSKVHNHKFATSVSNVVSRYNKKLLKGLIDNLPVEGMFMVDPNWKEFDEPLKNIGL